MDNKQVHKIGSRFNAAILHAITEYPEAKLDGTAEYSHELVQRYTIYTSLCDNSDNHGNSYEYEGCCLRKTVLAAVVYQASQHLPR